MNLGSGGSIVATVDVNLFDLEPDDRAFVIDLVDKLKGYPTAPRLKAVMGEEGVGPRTL